MSDRAEQVNKCQECGQLNSPNAILCQNCGTPRSHIKAKKDENQVGNQETPTLGGRINLQQFGQETPTSNRKLSRFAEAAAKKRQEKGNDSSHTESFDSFSALRSDLPKPTDFSPDDEESGALEELNLELPAFAPEDFGLLAEELRLPIEEIPPEERPIAAPSLRRSNLPQTGELPDWLSMAQPPGESVFHSSSVEQNPALDVFSLEETGNFNSSEVAPFELSPAERGLDTDSRFSKPATEDLDNGMPTWLRDLTSPSSEKQENRTSSRLRDQPVFVPFPHQTDELVEPPEGLFSPTERQPRPSRDVPEWLKRNQAEQDSSIGKPGGFGDVELEKALEEAFEESDPKSLARKLLGFDTFELEELPDLSNNNVVGVVRKSGTSELVDSASLPPLEELFIEESVEESDVATSRETAPTQPVAPWGEGVAPWLRGLELPNYTPPTTSKSEITLAPFTLAVEQQIESSKFIPTDEFEADKPKWTEEEAGSVQSSDETRPLSMRELLRQTNELTSPEMLLQEVKSSEDIANPPLVESQAHPIEEFSLADLALQQISDSSVDLPQETSSEENLIEQVASLDMPEWLNSEITSTESQEIPDELPAWLKAEIGDEPVTPTPGAVPDWLTTGVQAEKQVQEEEAIPDWLGEISSPDSTTVAEAVPDWLTTGVQSENQAQEEENIPDWLKGLKEELSIEKPIAAVPTEAFPQWLGEVDLETTAKPVEEVPEWLQPPVSESVPAPIDAPREQTEDTLEPFDLANFVDTEPEVSESSHTVVDAPGTSSAEIPEWLGEFEYPQGQAGEEEPPDWLKSMMQGTAPTRKAEEAPKTYSQVGSYALDAQLENIPEWLKDKTETLAAPTSPDTDVAKPVAQESQIGALLREIALLGDDEPLPVTVPEWLNAEKKPEPAPEIPMPLSEIPDWLKDDTADLKGIIQIEDVGTLQPNLQMPQMEVASPLSLEIEGQNFLGDLDVPLWLAQQSEPVVPEPAQAISQPSLTEFVPGQLPSWLRTVGPTVTEEPDLLSDSVKLADNLPVVTIPVILVGADVLNTLLSSSHKIVVEDKKEQKKPLISRATLLRYAAFMALLLAALLGILLTPIKDASINIQPNTLNFFTAVESLQSNQKVLLAYDWDAEVNGEMRSLSQSVTQHVMAKRSRIVTVSLNPQGPALASQILNELATRPEYGNSATRLYEYGTGYLNLGYRSGNEAALRSLFSNIGALPDYKKGAQASSYPVMQGINGLQDFDMIIVLAGNEGSVRSWVEQLSIQPNARLLLVTPSAVQPFAQPYVFGPPAAEAGSFGKFTRPQALLTGLSGAAQYQQLLLDRNISSDRNVNLLQRLNAQTFASLGLVLIIIVVNVVYLSAELRKRRGSA
ncbi:zinc ribbon domain-containing protein [Candidatus Chlorohelix sp.]|uniref:zinc ribbon domain-containing protein n=1 Tax=Candidatus Chlorohelix sp. TaxID=3139201 RepID=UPI00303DAC65